MARVLCSSHCSELWLLGVRRAIPLLKYIEKRIFSCLGILEKSSGPSNSVGG